MRRSAIFACTVGLTAGLLTPSALHSQVAGQVLTLEDALQLARDNNPGYLQSLNGVELADAQTRQAFMRILPQLNGNVSTRMSAQQTTLGTDPFGLPIQQSFYSQNSNSGWSVGLNATLFDGGRTLRNYWNARDNQLGTDASILQQEIALAAQITSQYLAAVRAERLIDQQQRNVQNAEAQLDNANQLYELAATTRTTVLGAQQSLNNTRQALQQAEAQARKQRMSLWQTIGMEGEPNFNVDAALPEVFDPANLDVEGLVARALTDNPQIRLTEIQLGQNRRSLTTEKWVDYLPQIGASFSYGGSTASRDDYSRFASAADMSRGYTLQLTATIPLFTTVNDRLQGSPGLVQARLGVENQELTLRQREIQLASQVRQAVIDLQVAYDALSVAQANARIAAERLALSDEEYRMGGVSYIEFQQVIDQESRARLDVVDRQFEFFNARTALEQLLGGSLNN